MNKKLVAYTLGKVLCLAALLMFLPLLVSIIYNEPLKPFILTIAATLLVGAFLVYFMGKRSNTLFIRDGYIIVTLSWICLTLVGALPFVISGSVPSYADAIFETMSGLTTTGASILTDVEALPHGILFWRSFTHWIGGMGVLVFIMAVAEKNPDRSINLMRAEMPGSRVDKIRPKARTNARMLYYIYLGLTVLEIIFLLAGGMSLFDSLCHTFGTAGTGGFGIKADSIGSYSAYLQYVIAIFMIIFGVNFTVFYLILMKNISKALHSVELHTYLLVIAFSTVIIVGNIYTMYDTIEETFRHSLFQVASIITTTGYSTVDFNAWPQLSKSVLFILMFIGGCEGSTAGGLKVSRVVILFKGIKQEIHKLLHPRIVTMVRMDGKPLAREVVNGVNAYFAVYTLVCALAVVLVSNKSMDFETNLTAVISCMNNIGPGFGSVGPMGSFAQYSGLDKLILSAVMLLGRLEIYPVILTFTNSQARKMK